MKGVAILVNIFLPGVGTLFVGKIGEGIAQIILYWIGVILCFSIVGAIVGVPLCIGIWIWALVSAASSQPMQPQQIIINNVVAGHGGHINQPGGMQQPSATGGEFRALPGDRL